MPAKGTRRLQRPGHNIKRIPMKQLSHAIINSTRSLLGRLTKVTTLGCMLALVFLVAVSAQPQKSGKARPFKASGIPILVAYPDDPTGMSGTFEVVGTATHLGKFVFPGTYTFLRFEGSLVYFHVHGTYTAANGDTIEIDCPEWVNDYGITPVVSSGIVDIIGGTGRFANASGSYVGVLAPGNAPTFFTAEGTISY
jgi:hypothetical protein